MCGKTEELFVMKMNKFTYEINYKKNINEIIIVINDFFVSF